MLGSLVLGCSVLGCAEGLDNLRDNLRARAAYEFQCPKEQIALEQLATDTVGASGCGHRVSYVRLCKNDALESECHRVH